jgi:pantetheine-phosphate adenylyltransferase
LEKAEQVFDKVVVARGINTQKMPVLVGKFIKPFKDIEAPEIKATGLDKILPTYETIFFTTLLTDVVEHYRSMGEVTVVRGLRNGFDLQAESNLVAIIQDIDPKCNVIYIPCDNNLAHVSSSAIRELASFDANNTRYLVNKFAYLERE